MKKGNIYGIVCAVLVCCTGAFAGPELPSKVYSPVPVQPAVPVKKSLWRSTQDYVGNRLCDVGDVIFQTVDAVGGIVNIDLAQDNCVR